MSGFAYEATVNETDHWLTPPSILKSLGDFDLDPCAYWAQPWKTAAKQYALPEDNGLLLPWQGRVWCNPPYGNETQRWMNRMSLHGNGIMLIFARTETIGFQDVWKFGDAVLFKFWRIAFHYRDGSPSDSGQAPSCLIAFGKNNVKSLRESGIRGALVTKWEYQ